MEGIRIAEYGPFRLDELLRLYGSVGWTNYTGHAEMLEQAYANSLKTLAAYDGETLVGVIRAIGDGCSILYIQDLLVLPEYQRRGIGSALTRRLLALYPDVYQKVLLTDDTEKTVRFYRSLGFQPAAEQGCAAFFRAW